MNWTWRGIRSPPAWTVTSTRPRTALLNDHRCSHWIWLRTHGRDGSHREWLRTHGRNGCHWVWLRTHGRNGRHRVWLRTNSRCRHRERLRSRGSWHHSARQWDKRGPRRIVTDWDWDSHWHAMGNSKFSYWWRIRAHRRLDNWRLVCNLRWLLIYDSRLTWLNWHRLTRHLTMHTR